MDTRTAAESARDATRAAALLLAVHESPFVNHLAQKTARLIVSAMSEDDVVVAEHLLTKALEESEAESRVNDIVVDGVKAARRFVFLAETGGR